MADYSTLRGSLRTPCSKRGDQRVCASYRGFTPLSTRGKVYSKVLERRVWSANLRLKRNNAVSAPGRGTTEPALHVFRRRDYSNVYFLSINVYFLICFFLLKNFNRSVYPLVNCAAQLKHCRAEAEQLRRMTKGGKMTTEAVLHLVSFTENSAEQPHPRCCVLHHSYNSQGEG